MAVVNSRPGGANIPPFDAVADVRKYAIVRDEFLGGLTTSGNVGELGWTITQVTGDSAPDVDQISTASVVLGHPGVIGLNTGATTPAANDEGALTLAGALQLPDSTVEGMVYAAAVVRFPNITAVEFNFGFFATSLNAGRDTNSVSLEFDASADGDWNAVTVAGSTATAVANTDIASSAVAVDTWYTLEVAADQNSAYFWVDGEQVAHITTNIPTAVLVPGFKVATEANAEKTVYIDAFMLRAPAGRVA